MAGYLERRRAQKEFDARKSDMMELAKQTRQERVLSIHRLSTGTNLTLLLMQNPQMDWNDPKVRREEKRFIRLVIVNPNQGLATVAGDSDHLQYRSNNKVFEVGETVKFPDKYFAQGELVPIAYRSPSGGELFTPPFALKQVHLPDYKVDMFPGRL